MTSPADSAKNANRAEREQRQRARFGNKRSENRCVNRDIGRVLIRGCMEIDDASVHAQSCPAVMGAIGGIEAEAHEGKGARIDISRKTTVVIFAQGAVAILRTK